MVGWTVVGLETRYGKVGEAPADKWILPPMGWA